MNDTNALDDGGILGGDGQRVAPRDGELFGIVEGLPEAQYHAHHALSSTGARLLLDSPARFKYRMTHPLHSDAFDLGTAVHTKVLGVGHPVALLDFADFRSKAAQQARDEAREAGWVPLFASVGRVVDAMAEAVLDHPTARKVLEQEGISEASVFGTCSGTGVRMRARFDHLPTDGGRTIAVDLKTTASSASPKGFAKSAATYQYEVQRAHYLDTLRYAAGDEDAELVFLVVEKDPPYMVGVYQLDAEFARMGHEKAKRAREIFRECTDSDVWPGFPADISLVSAPRWAIFEHEETFSA